MKLCTSCKNWLTCEFPSDFRELEYRHTGGCRNYKEGDNAANVAGIV